jgi:hypothetical protein
MGEWGYKYTILNSALDGGEWSVSRPVGVWVVPRVSLDVVEKRLISFPYREPNPDSLIVYPFSKRMGKLQEFEIRVMTFHVRVSRIFVYDHLTEPHSMLNHLCS